MSEISHLFIEWFIFLLFKVAQNEAPSERHMYFVIRTKEVISQMVLPLSKFKRTQTEFNLIQRNKWRC